MSPTTMDREALERRLADYLGRSPEPLACAYLFGSHARGASGGCSDVDVAVLLNEDNGTHLRGPLARLRGELERALKRPVDVIDLHRAPPDLVHRVLRDGRLLVDRGPERRIAFEVAARNAYFDVLPHIQRYRRVQTT